LLEIIEQDCGGEKILIEQNAGTRKCSFQFAIEHFFVFVEQIIK
jgi:hypothetical protein